MNVFQYGAICEKNWEQNLANMSGYERKYTFYSDFSIAEFCEVWMHDRGAIVDTFNRVLESWGSSIEAMSEVVLVLNHKIWSFYDGVDSSYLKCGEVNRDKIARLYDKLWRKATNFVIEKFGNDKDAMRYYYEVTD